MVTWLLFDYTGIMDLSKKPDCDILIITGPTASGKTSLSVALAARLNGEIISADSRQVYRKMDIGTGKDYDDYVYEGKVIPFHLIDIVDPGYKYNVFEYQRDFLRTFNDLKKKGIFPVVCGGSGMYIDSIISGYRMIEVTPDHGLRASLERKTMDQLAAILSTYKKLHNKTDFDTKKRLIRAIEIEHHNVLHKAEKTDFPSLRVLVAGIMLDRDTRRKRISARLHQRLSSGMIDEIKKLLLDGISSDALIYYGLEYKYITLYLLGKLTYKEMVSELETAIHRFAKRQMTWFRGMERKGILIHWIDGELSMSEKVEKVLALM